MSFVKAKRKNIIVPYLYGSNQVDQANKILAQENISKSKQTLPLKVDSRIDNGHRIFMQHFYWIGQTQIQSYSKHHVIIHIYRTVSILFDDNPPSLLIANLRWKCRRHSTLSKPSSFIKKYHFTISVIVKTIQFSWTRKDVKIDMNR